ncbi:MAG: protein disulfide oxidoreductase [Rhodocyclaceae bacterium]|jgi:thiol-disulfide isomerase/thioredoxin|nr:protein disulfide oxidoreductase [Rhodocyclaceae bacterium]
MISSRLSSLRSALSDPKRWRRWTLEALIVIAIVAGITTWQNSGLASGVAPPLSGTRTDGSTVKLGAEGARSGGGPAVGGGEAPAGDAETARLVVFWATWCKVCKANAGTIEAIAQDWPVITVAMQSGEREEVAEFLEERGWKVPAIADDDSNIAEAWGVRAVPAHFVVDPAGHIRFRVVGYTTSWGLRARLWWAQNIAN